MFHLSAHLLAHLLALARNNSGAAAVEYALLAGGIAIVAISATILLGESLLATYLAIGAAL